ncbi:MAG: hypothetical protein KGZ91_12300 [Afipia sp.]|jgi:hypothetical protein|nr:hypothetical protein [Afipia sp.]
MQDLPPTLAIALRLTGAIWIFGIVAMLMQADTRIVVAAFVVGLVTAIIEWIIVRNIPPPAGPAEDEDTTPDVRASTPQVRRVRRSP